MIELLAHWIIGFISASGYLGVFLLMAVESALIPLPSEVTMPFAGFLVSAGKMSFMPVVLAGTLGNLAGSLAAYALGFWGQEHVVRKIISRFGKYIFLSEHEFEKSEKWFVRYGQIIVFASRLLPGIRTYISLPAGISEMPVVSFAVYTFLGSLIWSAVLTAAGFFMGQNWTKITPYFHILDIVVVLAAFILIFRFLQKHLKNSKIKH